MALEKSQRAEETTDAKVFGPRKESVVVELEETRRETHESSVETIPTPFEVRSCVSLMIMSLMMVFVGCWASLSSGYTKSEDDG